MGTAHRGRGSFGQAPIQYLALFDERGNRIRHFFYRCIRVHPVLVVEVDVVGTQAAERTFYRPADGVGLARQAYGACRRIKVGHIHQVITEFRGDDYLVVYRFQSFAHQFLVLERAVHLCRVEERHAQFYRLAQRGDGFFPVRVGRIALRESHTAQSYFRNFQSLFP